MINYKSFKKKTKLRRISTPFIVRAVKFVELSILRFRYLFNPVVNHSKYNAIVHYGLQKTGTVWIRDILQDIEIYTKTGLKFYDCAGKDTIYFKEGNVYSPVRKINSNTLVAFEDDKIRCFVVVRDPVLQLLSWISSTENYHITSKVNDEMSKRREDLRSLSSIRKKFEYANSYFQKNGRYDDLRKLLKYTSQYDSLVISYDSLKDNDLASFDALFRYLGVSFTNDELGMFIDRYSLKAYGFDGKREKSSAIQNTSYDSYNNDDINYFKNLIPGDIKKVYEYLDL